VDVVRRRAPAVRIGDDETLTGVKSVPLF